MNHNYIILVFIVLFFSRAFGQYSIGISQINTFTPVDYNGGTQNWDIDQDQSGRLYFANNEGLLVFDGKHWKLYQLPNKTVVRSVKLSHDGKIYVGGQDEIGYFFPDSHGNLQFHSLKHLIAKTAQNFSDIWDIVIDKDDVYFRSSVKVLHYNGQHFRVYAAGSLWEYMGTSDGVLYAQDFGLGLLQFAQGKWEVVADDAVFKREVITSICAYDGKRQLITTLKAGLYLWDPHKQELNKLTTVNEQLFVNSRIYKAIALSDSTFALATTSAGCFVIDKQGNIIQQFSMREGLFKNNLRSIFMDHNKGIWLGLDEGINFIGYDSAIKYVFPDKEKQLSTYAALFAQNRLYVGTSNGLFVADIKGQIKDFSFSKEAFREVPNSSGQVWSLQELNQQVLMGHEYGGYILKNGHAHRINNVGTWLFEAVDQQRPAKNVVAGTYTGLQSLQFEQGTFAAPQVMMSLRESLRFITYDQGDIWASHPYRGIYRFRLSADKQHIVDIKLFTEQEGLPSALGNYITKIKGRIVVAAKNGMYEFDKSAARFVPSALLSPTLNAAVYHYLKEDRQGNIWFVSNKHIGMIDFNHAAGGKENSVVYFPELNGKVVAGFEHIYPYDAENIFIGSNTGLIHINFKKYLENIRALRVSLSSIRVFGKEDTTLFGGYFVKDAHIIDHQDATNKVVLDRHWNSLRFEFSSNLFEQQNNVEFSYQLSGFEDDWSKWSAFSTKEYTNLPAGNYVFRVKARNNLGNESQEVTYTFSIKPAWYETFWIYILYLCTALGAILLLVRYQRKKYTKEQRYLRYQHQLEIEHNEKKIVQLEKEKLANEVDFKNKELATTSMYLVQKNKLLVKIKERLSPLLKQGLTSEQTMEMKKVMRLLQEAENGESDWEQFAIHFDQIHSDFLGRLKDKHPSLSANDLKICAYLKMNLSSKEMAQLLNITIRAVEVSRYRLRKKLQVPSAVSLFDYLILETTGSTEVDR
ncbi:triple tyrosine motif-containing protein [Sphingobacterium sp. Mn56C]|uniref:triple tyrosine motif-containing protein n=1 Tax=Sphingobacterium sp. Mn56C TaxID=3395261 RepID=UPI003BD25C4F